MSDEKTEEGQWHELTDYFDAEQIKKIPIPGRVFLMGQVDDAIVVEVPASTSQQEIAAFQKYLVDNGMTSVCLVVPNTVRFLKMIPCDEETAEMLDKRQGREAEVEAEDECAGN